MREALREGWRKAKYKLAAIGAGGAALMATSGGALAVDMTDTVNTVNDMIPLIIVLVVLSMIVGVLGGMKIGR